MVIGGLQKLSLLDYPGKPCAIVFTQGCVFRCAYCHNPDLIPITQQGAITEEEVLSFLDGKRKMLDAVCITGGEPTIQVGLEEFIKKLKDRGFLVKLDTNGINPDIVESLWKQKLIDYVAMDLKQTWEKYDEVIRINQPKVVDRCKQTFELIQREGIPHEFRTTILPGSHTEEDFMTMAGYLKPGENYFIQPMNFKITLDDKIPRETGFDVDALMVRLHDAYPLIHFEKR